ncbi:MAG: sulfatase-like hydrolase/transferase, partial [Mariniblastus sp.]|nr:sulfatase-like hydrolase/transferase [Mariniblastus sp.]
HNRDKVLLDGETYSHDLILDAALTFIRNNQDRPFFCFMPVTIPHAAMQAPKHLHDKYRKQFPQFEAKVGKYAGTTTSNPVAAFPAMVEHLDNGVGEVLDLLKTLDIQDQTLVIFTSDNGPHQEGGHQPDFWDSNGPLRGIKRDLYEGGIRSPFIACWPGHVKAGTTSDHVSAFWDMLPTFCEMASVDAPRSIDGISMLPALLGENQPEHDFLYWEYPQSGGAQAIRKGKYKAVRRNLMKNPDAKIELYNLETDLGEEVDLASQHPQIVQEMSELFQTSRVDSPTFKLFKLNK